MDLHLTASNFTNSTGVIPYTDAIVASINDFFGLFFFLLWIIGVIIIYTSELKTTNAKKLFESLTAISLFCLIICLFGITANTATLTYVSPYWIFFYILMTAIAYKNIESSD